VIGGRGTLIVEVAYPESERSEGEERERGNHRLKIGVSMFSTKVSKEEEGLLR